jgi:uracil-DNA glycosylase
MIKKQKELSLLWKNLAENKKVTKSYKIRKGKRINIGFINQYSLHNSIPNKWFDWSTKTDAKIMIIGQDWGPYSVLQKFITEYEIQKQNSIDFDHDSYLFETFSSRTENFIIKAIEKTYFEKLNKKIAKADWNNFFFTVAIMFTRQGTHFRGNEYFDEKLGVKESLPHLKKQIKIIDPQIIMPLGGIAWKMIDTIFELHTKLTISQIIKKQKGEPIIIQNTKIIPNFHPASHTDPKIQMQIWKTIWENL